MRRGLRGGNVQAPAGRGRIFGQEFQRDEAAKLGVFRLVDDTHAPAAEFFDDAVMGDDAVDERLGIVHVRGMLSGGARRCQRKGFLAECGGTRHGGDHRRPLDDGVARTSARTKANAWRGNSCFMLCGGTCMCALLLRSGVVRGCVLLEVNLMRPAVVRPERRTCHRTPREPLRGTSKLLSVNGRLGACLTGIAKDAGPFRFQELLHGIPGCGHERCFAAANGVVASLGERKGAAGMLMDTRPSSASATASATANSKSMDWSLTDPGQEVRATKLRSSAGRHSNLT